LFIRRFILARSARKRERGRKKRDPNSSMLLNVRPKRRACLKMQNKQQFDLAHFVLHPQKLKFRVCFNFTNGSCWTAKRESLFPVRLDPMWMRPKKFPYLNWPNWPSHAATTITTLQQSFRFMMMKL